MIATTDDELREAVLSAARCLKDAEYFRVQISRAQGNALEWKEKIEKLRKEEDALEDDYQALLELIKEG